MISGCKDRDSASKYWESLDPVKRRRVEAEVAAVAALGLASASAPMGMSILAAPVFDDHDVAATIAVVGGVSDDARTAAVLRRAAFRTTVDMGGTDLWRSLVPGGVDEVDEVADSEAS